MTSRATSPSIYQLEQMAFAAWPAREIQLFGPWSARYNDGVTRRANSVWPNGPIESPDIDQQLAAVEAFYQTRHAPPRFQLCPVSIPAHLDNLLESRGYTYDGQTNVQTADVNTVIGRCNFAPIFRFQISTHVDSGWFNLQTEGIGSRSHQIRLGIMQRIPSPTLYVEAFVAHTPIAQVMGAVDQESGWIGIFNLYTHPNWRGQGAGTAVMHTLLSEAQKQGVSHTYLQVLTDNHKANALYHRLSYKTLYQYHYRTLAS